MSLPGPAPGLVIRYAFLWSHEAKAGHREGRKDRPAAILVAVRRTSEVQSSVVVVPITHRKPSPAQPAIEIPATVSKVLGLDGDRHWIRLDELNRFSWPGYDLRPIPGSKPPRYVYGMLPKPLFEQVRQAILALEAERRPTAIDRDT